MRLEFLTEDEYTNVDTFESELKSVWVYIYIDPTKISGWFLPMESEFDFNTINLLLDGQFITVKQTEELRRYLDKSITNVKYEEK